MQSLTACIAEVASVSWLRAICTGNIVVNHPTVWERSMESFHASRPWPSLKIGGKGRSENSEAKGYIKSPIITSKGLACKRSEHKFESFELAVSLKEIG
jgi:hypothetical protein